MTVLDTFVFEAHSPAMSKSAVIIATLVAIITFGTGTAFANPSSASGSCEYGVTYEGHDYPNVDGNTVTVYIDGVEVQADSFAGHFSGNVPNPDNTVSHTWRVVWDRVDGTNGDRTQSGLFGACGPTTTTVATTVAPTSTIGAINGPADVCDGMMFGGVCVPLSDATTTTFPPVSFETTTTVVLADDCMDDGTTRWSMQPCTVASDVGTPALPATGRASERIALVGLVLFAVGALLLGVRWAFKRS